MKRLLFVSYHYPPFEYVGALRAAGFARYLPEFGWFVTVLTATKQEGLGVNHDTEAHYVAPEATSWIYRVLPLRDPGIRWLRPLKQYIETLQPARSFDAVLVTGGPFLQFEIISWLKRKYPKLPVVLDFRDPFASNPRLESRWLRDVIAGAMERRWIRRADLTLVVTKRARELLSLQTARELVIENGYDDAVLSEVRQRSTRAGKEGEFLIAYTGKFYQNHNPVPVLRAIQQLRRTGIRARLVHAGTSHPSLEPALREFDSDVYCALGQRSYREALEVIRASDLGLILSTGAGYPATTKIYDYIGLEKHLLLIDPPPRGGILEVACRYDRFTCAGNDAEAVARALRSIYREPASSTSQSSSSPVALFGRRHQTERLAQALHALVSA